MFRYKDVILIFFPSFYAVFWIIWSTITGGTFWEHIAGSYYPFFLLALPIIALIILPLLFLLIGLVLNKQRTRYLQIALLMPCIISPMFVTSHWAVLGFGSGDYLTFLHWLTKNPNFGTVNYEILLGIICVFGSLFIPSLYSFFIIRNKNKLIYPIVCVILYCIVFIPVFIRLDIDSWRIFSVMQKMMPSIGLTYLGGQLIRVISFFVMIILLVYNLKRNNSEELN